MKRGIYIFVVISLLVGLMAVVGCTTGKEGTPGNSPETEGFSTVVQMNGKELTVGAPGLELWDSSVWMMLTVVVKNSGHEPIHLATLELLPYNSDGSELKRPSRLSEDQWSKERSVSVKELFPGEVQTLYLEGALFRNASGFKVQVKGLE